MHVTQCHVGVRVDMLMVVMLRFIVVSILTRHMMVVPIAMVAVVLVPGPSAVVAAVAMPSAPWGGRARAMARLRHEGAYSGVV